MNYRMFFTLLALIFVFSTTHASTVPVFDEISTWGGSGLDYSADFVTDTEGNMYLTGYFNTTVDLDPGAGTANATSNGSGDISFSKFNSDGVFQWVKTWGGTGDDGSPYISLNNGDVYISCRFQNTVDFDPGVGTAFATSSGGYDLCLSKFDSDGTFEWVKTWGGTGSDVSAQVTFGPDEKIYALSVWLGTVDFDPGPGTSFATSSGGYDVSLSRFDTDGTFEWVKTWGGTGNDSASVPLNPVFDSEGAMYLTGGFANTVDFDPGAGTTNAISSGSGDAYLLKLSSDGTFEWVKTWGGTGDDASRSMAIDSVGSLYIGGYFNGTADLDPGVGMVNATSNGSADAYLSKLSSDGTFEWVKTWGGTGFDFSLINGIDSDDKIYLRGDFASTVDFNPGSGTRSVTSNGTSDSYVSKFDSDGTFEWVKAWGGTGSEFNSTFNVVGEKLYALGWFQSTVDFNPSADTSNKTSNGSWDAYLLSFDLIEPAVTLSPTTGSLDEASSDIFNYTLELSAPPTDDVVVTITPDTQLSVSTTSLTFASSTWNIAQTVTVNVVDDEDFESDIHTGTITHTTASDDIPFDTLTVDSMTVSIAENDYRTSSGGSRGTVVRTVTPSTVTPPAPTEPATPLTLEERTQLINELKQQVILLIQQLVALLQKQLADM